MSRKRKLAIVLVAVYVALLAVSHAVRRLSPDGAEPGEGQLRVELISPSGTASSKRPVVVTYLDLSPNDAPDAATVVLVHGTPGRKEDLLAVGLALADRYRVIVPDLPGFGASSPEIPDYSMRAHARYLDELLDRLGIGRAHLVGFSFGSGVALELWELDPGRVASVTLLSGSGVQELELVGDYHVNHALHGLQLVALWLVHEGVPHMGYLDDSVLSVAYARNLYDTDQRRLRGILERIEPPVLILHGREDPLVPPAAAIEHHRIVPQSELVMLDASHFMPFTRPAEVAKYISEFVGRVEDGDATDRGSAESSRTAEAALPFDPSSLPPASGIALVVLVGLIATATLISEDLTCIAVGLLVARGSIGFVPGTLACFLGIFVGDMSLYVLGRYVGRPIVSRAPVRWFLRPEQLEASSQWFERRGPVVIGVSRFVPGTRLPTYLAAGVLHTRFLPFALWFVLASAVWTPLLVGLSSVVGAPGLAIFEQYVAHSGVALAITALLVLLLARLVMGATTHRGRRLLIGRWRRLTRWEFWPPWIFYPPVVAYVAWLGLRFRGPTLFTAANPAMPAGGFLGESKAAILEGLREGGAPVARFTKISREVAARRGVAEAKRFMAETGLSFPIVVKPDVGQRGRGVVVARDDATLEHALVEAGGDVVLQEHVPGHELGVFYYRFPGATKGRILSITDKRMPVVEGDGERTLARLIVDDDRAVCMARTYLTAQAEHLEEVPAPGERVPLVDLGTHCRGAIFLDGARFRTEELERSVDEMSRAYGGFYFGRYDLRGRGLEPGGDGAYKVIELNGVTSESTDIYDPGNGLIDAYRKLFRQWRIAFEIGERNRARGVRPVGLTAIGRMVLEFMRAR